MEVIIAEINNDAAISSNVANIEVKKTWHIYKDFTLQFNRVLIQNEKKVGIQTQKTNQIVYLGSYKINKIKNKNKRAFLHWLTLCFLCHNYLWQASAICQWFSKYNSFYNLDRLSDLHVQFTFHEHMRTLLNKVDDISGSHILSNFREYFPPHTT